ncbi:hypothetical protein EJ06DRAFT_43711 [Trichodelitschia bisporula]|uniref:Uncharacterized protein n=1 Tax=Trichodelitschia bisporula TaxID=703511 RepID=A0A6G1HWA5_9PEZI|nr:hypothetical protein EJ06DRAFT_43711 [Trichodelitschia bisporula]
MIHGLSLGSSPLFRTRHRLTFILVLKSTSISSLLRLQNPSFPHGPSTIPPIQDHRTPHRFQHPTPSPTRPRPVGVVSGGVRHASRSPPLRPAPRHSHPGLARLPNSQNVSPPSAPHVRCGPVTLSGASFSASDLRPGVSSSTTHLDYPTRSGAGQAVYRDRSCSAVGAALPSPSSIAIPALRSRPVGTASGKPTTPQDLRPGILPSALPPGAGQATKLAKSCLRRRRRAPVAIIHRYLALRTRSVRAGSWDLYSTPIFPPPGILPSALPPGAGQTAKGIKRFLHCRRRAPVSIYRHPPGLPPHARCWPEAGRLSGHNIPAPGVPSFATSTCSGLAGRSSISLHAPTVGPAGTSPSSIATSQAFRLRSGPGR